MKVQIVIKIGVMEVLLTIKTKKAIPHRLRSAAMIHDSIRTLLKIKIIRTSQMYS